MSRISMFLRSSSRRKKHWLGLHALNRWHLYSDSIAACHVYKGDLDLDPSRSFVPIMQLELKRFLFKAH